MQISYRYRQRLKYILFHKFIEKNKTRRSQSKIICGIFMDINDNLFELNANYILIWAIVSDMHGANEYYKTGFFTINVRITKPVISLQYWILFLCRILQSISFLWTWSDHVWLLQPLKIGKLSYYVLWWLAAICILGWSDFFCGFCFFFLLNLHSSKKEKHFMIQFFKHKDRKSYIRFLWLY